MGSSSRRLASRGRRAFGTSAVAAFLIVAASLVAVAADTPPKEDEWWKRGKAPKPHGPVAWSVGFFAGSQDWRGLADLAPTDAERAAGWRGAFGRKSSIYGVGGWIQAGRFGTTDLGVDLFYDRFSNETTEPAFEPDPNVVGLPVFDHTVDVRRLGIGARSVFLTSSRLQPTVSLALALDDASVSTVARATSGGYEQRFSPSRVSSLDAILTVGCDVALQKDVTAGWRARLSLGVEHRGFDGGFAGFPPGRAGPLAYTAEFGVLYRHQPASLRGHPR